MADPSNHIEEMLSRDEIKVALDALTERQRKAVVMRETEQRTFQEIGEALGVTRERARQIYAKGMRLLKRKLGELQKE
jgi:RNA polymerase sigma factor (sigma-70 family)